MAREADWRTEVKSLSAKHHFFKKDLRTDQRKSQENPTSVLGNGQLLGKKNYSKLTSHLNNKIQLVSRQQGLKMNPYENSVSQKFQQNGGKSKLGGQLGPGPIYKHVVGPYRKPLLMK